MEDIMQKTSSSFHRKTHITSDLFSQLKEELPVAFGRTAVDQLLPGIISSKTLANLDSLGRGPKNRYTQGRKVFYRREEFIDFLMERTSKLGR